MLYQDTGQGTFTNLYNVKIVNKTFEKLPVQLKLLQPEGKINVVGGKINIPPSEIAETSFFVEIDKSKIFTVSTPIKIGVYSGDLLLEEVNTNFMGPQMTTKQQ
jgi:hypothetical protein